MSDLFVRCMRLLDPPDAVRATALGCKAVQLLGETATASASLRARHPSAGPLFVGLVVPRPAIPRRSLVRDIVIDPWSIAQSVDDRPPR